MKYCCILHGRVFVLPWDIAAIDTGHIIVTIPGEEQLQVLQVSPRLSIGRVMHIKTQCHGVDVIEINIYVTCTCIKAGSNTVAEIRILDMNGCLHRRFDISNYISSPFKCPFYIAVDSTSKNMYFSDRSDSSVTCLSS